MPIFRSCWLFVLFVACYFAPGWTRAQEITSEDKSLSAEKLTSVAEAPLASKKMARLLRAGRRTPQELAQEWEQSAPKVWLGLQWSIHPELDPRPGVCAAPVPGERFFTAARSLLEARLALASTPEERRAALEIYWTQAQDVADLVYKRVGAGIGSYGPADDSAARSEALLAGNRLLNASEGRSAGFSFLPPGVFIEDPLGRKDDARKRRAVLTTPPAVLLQAAREECRKSLETRPPSSHIRVDIAARDRERLGVIERIFRTDSIGQVAILRAEWEFALEREEAARNRLDVPGEDDAAVNLLIVRTIRLHAEYLLVEALKKHGHKSYSQCLDTGTSTDSPVLAKESARMRFAALERDPRTVALQAREALTQAHEVILEQWRSDQPLVRVEGCLATIQRSLDVELFLARDREERETALRRALERLLILEDLTKRFMIRGIQNFVFVDLYTVQAQRLQTEYQLARERAKKD